MATINLTWTPAGGPNSTGQKVQRKSGAGLFADISSILTANASTYSDTTAVNNVLYTYQIVNLCTVGGPEDSADVQAGKAVCPDITETVEGNAVELSFPTLSGNAVYQGNIVIDNGIGSYSSGNAQTGQLISFEGLYNTTYNYNYSVAVGTNVASCSGSVTTTPPPSCPSPTNLTAVVS
jgi:hypothetical protein